VRTVILRAAPGAKIWSAGHDISELPTAHRDPLGWSDPLRVVIRAVCASAGSNHCGYGRQRAYPQRPLSFSIGRSQMAAIIAWAPRHPAAAPWRHALCSIHSTPHTWPGSWDGGPGRRDAVCRKAKATEKRVANPQPGRSGPAHYGGKRPRNVRTPGAHSTRRCVKNGQYMKPLQHMEPRVGSKPLPQAARPVARNLHLLTWEHAPGRDDTLLDSLLLIDCRADEMKPKAGRP
jgi:hypothetical protein